MKSVNINVQVDATDKKLFENFCSSIGMDVSTVINMFIKVVNKEQKLPFEIKTSTFNDTIYSKLREAELEMSYTIEKHSKEDVLKSMNDIIG